MWNCVNNPVGYSKKPKLRTDIVVVDRFVYIKKLEIVNNQK